MHFQRTCPNRYPGNPLPDLASHPPCALWHASLPPCPVALGLQTRPPYARHRNRSLRPAAAQVLARSERNPSTSVQHPRSRPNLQRPRTNSQHRPAFSRPHHGHDPLTPPVSQAPSLAATSRPLAPALAAWAHHPHGPLSRTRSPLELHPQQNSGDANFATLDLTEPPLGSTRTLPLRQKSCAAGVASSGMPAWHPG